MGDPKVNGTVGSGAQDLLRAFRRGWILVLLAGLVVGLGAFGFSVAQAKMYSSTATLYVTSGSESNSDSAFAGGQAAQQRVASYTQLVKSDAIVDAALRDLGRQLSVNEVKNALTSTPSAETVLLSVTAKWRDPGTAASLANAVSRAMSRYVLGLETPTGGGQPLAKLTLITPAQENSVPVSPKIVNNVLIGIVAGLFVGILTVLIHARFSTKLRTESDLAALLSESVLGVIPSSKTVARMKPVEFDSASDSAVEAYRKLAANIPFADVDSPPKVIVVSSAGPSEGKTTTCLNLAAALVETGQRVVVVDGDLRRPQIAERLGALADVGLTSYLRGDCEILDVVQKLGDGEVYCITSGPVPPNPIGLLSSERVQNGLQALAAEFDYVLIDAAPILPVVDTVRLTQSVDGVLLVARAGKTKAHSLTNAVVQLQTAKRRVCGCVLNDAKDSLSQYQYSYTKDKA